MNHYYTRSEAELRAKLDRRQQLSATGTPPWQARPVDLEAARLEFNDEHDDLIAAYGRRGAHGAGRARRDELPRDRPRALAAPCSTLPGPAASRPGTPRNGNPSTRRRPVPPGPGRGRRPGPGLPCEAAGARHPQPPLAARSRAPAVVGLVGGGGSRLAHGCPRRVRGLEATPPTGSRPGPECPRCADDPDPALALGSLFNFALDPARLPIVNEAPFGGLESDLRPRWPGRRRGSPPAIARHLSSSPSCSIAGAGRRGSRSRT